MWYLLGVACLGLRRWEDAIYYLENAKDMLKMGGEGSMTVDTDKLDLIDQHLQLIQEQQGEGEVEVEVGEGQMDEEWSEDEVEVDNEEV